MWRWVQSQVKYIHFVWGHYISYLCEYSYLAPKEVYYTYNSLLLRKYHTHPHSFLFDILTSWFPVKIVVVMCRVMMYKKAVSLFKAKTFSHSTLMNFWAMNQAKPHLHWCFLHLPRQPLTVIPLKTLQDLCFAYTFVTGLFNFVRIAILLDAFLHKRIKQTSKGSDFGSGVSVNKGCRVQNHTTACRKLDVFFIASCALTVWMWCEANKAIQENQFAVCSFALQGLLLPHF